MSLPTQGVFRKDGKIVGVGACNPGWSVNEVLVTRCIKDAMDNAWAYFDPNKSGEHFKNEKFVERWERDRANKAKYFTTPEDLKNFEYLDIFDYRIPRDYAIAYYFGKISKEDVAENIIKITEEDRGLEGDNDGEE